MKKKIRNWLIGALACAILGSVVGFGYSFAEGLVKKTVNTVKTTINKVETPAINAEDKDQSDDTKAIMLMDQASQDTVNIIKAVKPSVVCITSKANVQSWFYGTQEAQYSGSGVIFYEDNEKVYIVTNNSVISGATNVLVSVSESELINASLVGKNASNDLAVISVLKSNLKEQGVNSVTVAKLGDSSTTQVGETVIAIGNALGEGNIATKGIVSSTSKKLNTNIGTLEMMQTDAAINPGNDGGALVNSDGYVIGINTTKVSNTTVEGIGYAIPSNIVKTVVEGIMQTGETPTLGVKVTTITEDMAKQYGLPGAGVYISEVTLGGSANSAGLREGDVITAYNGSPVFSADGLVETLRKSKIGDTVTLTVYRDGKSSDVPVTLKKATGF
ncbi:MAG TPA: peptidase S1 [Lachnospiraceae bacterium]|nr:peptidase S1 [Lachnospiraceae bacterium]